MLTGAPLLGTQCVYGHRSVLLPPGLVQLLLAAQAPVGHGVEPRFQISVLKSGFEAATHAGAPSHSAQW